LTSSTVPLEWNGGSLHGSQGGPDNPVIWKDILFNKTVTLNFGGLGPVASYETSLKLSAGHKLAKGQFQIPTIYLGPDFNHYYAYDAAENVLAAANASVRQGVSYLPKSGYGGMIVATVDGNYAMGIYGLST